MQFSWIKIDRSSKYQPFYTMLMLLFLSCFTIHLQGQTAIRYQLSDDLRQIEVDQLPTKLLNQVRENPQRIGQFFKLSLQPKKETDSPAILGKYSFIGDKIIFQPLLPFQCGLGYVVQIAGQTPHYFSIPFPTDFTPTTLTTIYPSADTLPANLLKIYLHFSQPMSEGQAYAHLKLYDQNGEQLEGNFLALSPELWDEHRQRLTVWFEPGRIKRALGPNVKTGSPLVEGQQYKLVVSKNWKDAKGHALTGDYEKHFVVTKADRQSPNMQKWTYTFPSVFSKEPLKIHFGEPIDHAVAMKTFVVKNDQQNEIPGAFRMDNQESMLFFYPSNSWGARVYHLKVAAYLEDLAGNNLNRLFDRDLLTSKSKVSTQTSYTFTFDLSISK